MKLTILFVAIILNICALLYLEYSKVVKIDIKNFFWTMKYICLYFSNLHMNVEPVVFTLIMLGLSRPVEDL